MSIQELQPIFQQYHDENEPTLIWYGPPFDAVIWQRILDGDETIERPSTTTFEQVVNPLWIVKKLFPSLMSWTLSYVYGRIYPAVFLPTKAHTPLYDAQMLAGVIKYIVEETREWVGD